MQIFITNCESSLLIMISKQTDDNRTAYYSEIISQNACKNPKEK